jgi:4-amino-4-deoxy-L-arabinose transferase-like glycosyltransferase
MNRPATLVTALIAAYALTLCAGLFSRGLWTPDEPREADLSWRMSWQADKSVPQLAGQAFCEKPPLTYWLAGAAARVFGPTPTALRIPNFFYAMLTALAVAMTARRALKPAAGPASSRIGAVVAAAAIGTFLLSYQVAIWLATDAPLQCAVALALYGLHRGFYAQDSSQRWRGYLIMHAALAAGFFCKSAAAYIVPALAFASLVVWERRWRELWCWELYLGLLLQAALIGAWVWQVYTGPAGVENLKVFFWNNLVGRFTSVAAPAELQYAAGHRNFPGKYLLELPLYLAPWTLLVIAALRRAWTYRKHSPEQQRPIRFALACFVPALVLLSLSATARSVYLAPALPGLALLLGWWAAQVAGEWHRWDRAALQGTAALLLAAVLLVSAALMLLRTDPEAAQQMGAGFMLIAIAGIAIAAGLAAIAWRRAAQTMGTNLLAALFLAYCALLAAPVSRIYTIVDRWQDLAGIGRELRQDLGARELILFAPDETTRAWVDLYTRTSVTLADGTADPAGIARLRAQVNTQRNARVLAMLPGRNFTGALASVAALRSTRSGAAQNGAAQNGAAQNGDALIKSLGTAGLNLVKVYEVANGRRYALLASADADHP